MTADDLAKQLQPFIDEMQVRVYAQEAILQSIMTRLFSSDGNWLNLLSAIEQQSLHTLSNRGPQFEQFAGAHVLEFFETLRKWKQSETTAAPGSGSAH